MATQKVNIDVRTKGAKKSKDEIGGLGRSIKSIGIAAMGASSVFFSAKGLIDAFSKQEMAEKKLETA